jgi:hypothetical protein
MLSVYDHRIENGLDDADYHAISRYIKLIQWGRKNPVSFMEKVFDVKLLDYQKYLLQSSWDKEFVVWLMTRNGGKSFLVALFSAERGLLYPRQDVKIISNVGRQSNETFAKLESFAKHQINTIVSQNTVFWDELDVKANGDGFKHESKNGDSCTLLNGSEIAAVAGSVENIRGKRSTMSIYDEAGVIRKSVYEVTEKYQMQDSAFKTGTSFDVRIYPPEIPNVTLYAGTASDTGSVFFAKYKEGYQQMLMGNPKWFVADINCDVPLHPTMDGQPYPPLFAESKVELALKENQINGEREFYNRFDTFDTNHAVVSMASILDSEYVYPPTMTWGGKKHKYILCWDPAPKLDNSIVLVTEIFTDEADGKIKGRFVNMENLIQTYSDGKVAPMTSIQQVQRVREMVYEYNGRDNIAPYDNVMLLVDSGAGGQPYPAVQMLMADWQDSKGVTHPGLYDDQDEASKRWVEPFPKAIPGRIRLISPRKLRTDMFNAARTLIPEGAMQFPVDAPSCDEITPDVGRWAGEVVHLDKAMKQSLHQMQLMKTEMCSMVATKNPSTGITTFQMPPEKTRRGMHDDRNYVAIMACWWVEQLRQGLEVDAPELNYVEAYNRVLRHGPSIGVAGQVTATAPDAAWSSYLGSIKTESGVVGGGPFQGSNPFKNR